MVDFDDPEETLVACLPVELNVNGQAVAVEARFFAEDVATAVLAFPPIEVDPVPGEPGVVDADGRLDGRFVFEEEAG